MFDKLKDVLYENPPLIIGFSGKIGSGKDHIAKEILNKYLGETNGENLRCINIGFGDALKVHLMATYPDIATFYNMFIKKTYESRKLLQNVATETRKTDDTIWIRHLDAWIKLYASWGVEIIIISDVRFKIEIDYIKSMGGLLFRVISPFRTKEKMCNETNNDDESINVISNHISETELDNMPDDCFNGILYNDPFDNNTNIIIDEMPTLYKEKEKINYMYYKTVEEYKEFIINRIILETIIKTIENKFSIEMKPPYWAYTKYEITNKK